MQTRQSHTRSAYTLPDNREKELEQQIKDLKRALKDATVAPIDAFARGDLENNLQGA